MNTFIQQGCIKLIKSDNKDIYNVNYFFIINAAKLSAQESKK